MKEVYQQLWEAFSDIYFEEVPHKYTDSFGTKYNSHDTIFQKNINFANDIINKLNEISPKY